MEVIVSFIQLGSLKKLKVKVGLEAATWQLAAWANQTCFGRWAMPPLEQDTRMTRHDGLLLCEKRWMDPRFFCGTTGIRILSWEITDRPI